MQNTVSFSVAVGESIPAGSNFIQPGQSSCASSRNFSHTFVVNTFRLVAGCEVCAFEGHRSKILVEIHVNAGSPTWNALDALGSPDEIKQR